MDGSIYIKDAEKRLAILDKKLTTIKDPDKLKWVRCDIVAWMHILTELRKQDAIDTKRLPSRGRKGDI